jgi:alpha-ketoglutarate-dependent taurine dioxygenase
MLEFQGSETKGSLYHSIPMVEASTQAIDPSQWASKYQERIEELLLTHGGVLLRNFNVVALSEFNRFAKTMDPDLLDYSYRSTPRKILGGKIYTSTEYPADRHIAWHNENSYSDQWPKRVLFFCVIPASIEGGETPIVDSRKVYQSLDKEIREEFEAKKVKYVRNYQNGIDLSWQEVFQTESKKDVESYCNAHGISYTWGDGSPILTTEQVCQASHSHPTTGEKVWFNQAHLFHISNLERDAKRLLLEELGSALLPRNAYYGDGTEIEEDALNEIRKTYKEHEIVFPWQKSDILILDNVLMAHARRPYKGDRKIAVAMY